MSGLLNINNCFFPLNNNPLCLRNDLIEVNGLKQRKIFIRHIIKRLYADCKIQIFWIRRCDEVIGDLQIPLNRDSRNNREPTITSLQLLALKQKALRNLWETSLKLLLLQLLRLRAIWTLLCCVVLT